MYDIIILALKNTLYAIIQSVIYSNPSLNELVEMSKRKLEFEGRDWLKTYICGSSAHSSCRTE